MPIALSDLIVPQTKDELLAQLLASLQGIGPVTQSGANGAPPAGLGDFEIAGVPDETYQVMVQIVAGGDTADVTIRWSLDGGNLWSSLGGVPTASSGGAHPWSIALTDYRASNAPTGLTITFSDAAAPNGPSSWVAGETYAFQGLAPSYSLTDFASGSVQWTMLQTDAQVLSDFSTLVAEITAGGFTSLASLPWLQLLAQEFYDIPPKPALPTIGQLLVYDGGGLGPTTIQPGGLVAAAESGNLYLDALSGPAILPKNGSILVQVQSQKAGSGYNDPALDIQTLVTSMPGVQVSNPRGSNMGAGPWSAGMATGVSTSLGGFLVRPTVPNGYIFASLSATGSLAGATEPVWPTEIGQTVADGAITWLCFGVDGAADSYSQVGDQPGTGLLWLTPNGDTTPNLSVDVVVRIVTTGFCGGATIALSTDGGNTFGPPVALAQQSPASGAGNEATWAPTTVYASGKFIYPVGKTGYYYKATQVGSGTSGATAPAWPTTIGVSVADGTVTWECVGYGYGQLVAGTGGALQAGVSSPDLQATVAVVFRDGPGAPDLQGTRGAFFAGDSWAITTDWASQYGQDEESQQALSARCQGQWTTLAMGLPLPQIEAWALAASPEVQAATAVPDNSGAGIVNLYVAGSGGAAVSSAGLAAVGAYVSQRLSGGVTLGSSGASTGLPVTALEFAIALGATIYVKAAQLTAAQTALSAGLLAYQLAVGVGGTVRYSQVMALLQGLPGVAGNQGYVDGVTLNGGTLDIVLSDGYTADITPPASPWVTI